METGWFLYQQNSDDLLYCFKEQWKVIVFLKRNIDGNFKNCIISLTEPTTPLIFMRNPVGLSYLQDILFTNI